MTLAKLIRQALEQRGLTRLQEASPVLGISVELLRVILQEGHVPKDKTLCKIAESLGLDKSLLIMSAHREKVPVELQGFFLSPAAGRSGEKKRVWPLSEECCNYLSTIMDPEEIQMVRKYRQVPQQEQGQIIAYVDHLFARQRVGTAALSADEERTETMAVRRAERMPGKQFSAYAVNPIPGRHPHAEKEDEDQDENKKISIAGKA
jgi:transcriptional regulator with XRE-family HTH domain